MSNNSIRVLLVEDEQHIAQGLIFNLQQEGYLVVHATTAKEALQQLEHQQFSLAILDRMLPGKLDGLDICRHIRQHNPQLPILMLTAMNREKDRIEGLTDGADDYLAKPFALDELLLRIAGMLRRSGWYRPIATENNSYTFGSYHINLTSGDVTGAEHPIHLTELEIKMLRVFFNHDGEVLSRAFLLKSVWELDPDTETRTLDNFIVRLRKYFEINPSNPQYFTTVRGQGYRFQRQPR
ncbi:MAG: response regulator transcription factor [Thermodesulfobacteriota bacterium]|nr:response regulator transcription factor [Thermodesulfobacteriota bacterium]